jgi:hypothetical protein
VLKIRNTKGFGPKLRTLNQTFAKVVPSIIKSKKFCVKLKVSLEEKVYSKTYYHHS